MRKSLKQMEQSLSTSKNDNSAFGGLKKVFRRFLLNPTAEVSLEVSHSLKNTDRVTDVETIKDIDIRILETRLTNAIKDTKKIRKSIKKSKSKKEIKALKDDLISNGFTVKYFRSELTKARRK